MELAKRINGNMLKGIAILAMTVDHTTGILFPRLNGTVLDTVLHVIGRLAAPIMFFFVCEGFHYTANRRRYAGRMFLFAFISHFAYCFAYDIPYLPFSTGSIFNQTGVMWTLAWSVVALSLFYGAQQFRPWVRNMLFVLILVITFPANWSCIAVLAIVSMYEHRLNLTRQMGDLLLWTAFYGVVSFFFYDRFYGLIQLGVILAWPVLRCYNGEKGKAKWMKWVFYLYYPLHLAVLGGVKLLLV